MAINDYLGSSMKYPVGVNSLGRAEVVTGLDSVKQGILDVLKTPVGTRFMLPEYGSRLSELIGEPVDEVLYSMLRLFVFDAVEKWEKRVKLLRVDIVLDPESKAVNCVGQFQVLASNEIDSFIYPFYRKLKY